MLLILHTVKVKQLVHRLLLWQSAADRGDRNVVAQTQPPTKAALSFRNFNLDVLSIQFLQFFGIPGINIMQVDPLSALAIFGIGLWPFVRRLQIQHCILFAFFIFQIKVNNNVILRKPYKVELRRIQILQCRLAFVPGNPRFASAFRLFLSVLGLTVLQHLIEQ